VTDAADTLRSALADRYALERELGRGGMATVYLARDLRHDRPVALKVLDPGLSASLGPERFLREIRTTARLEHPHILPLLDSGEAAGLLWYTMPYVEGESLRERLRREGQLPLEHALRIASEVADALDCAHEHGIVHRDIKPENILLSGHQSRKPSAAGSSERVHARVADFGIARALEAAGGGDLTATGVAVGTPVYMSPEQASGGTVDARSDVFALGCVLYEMLAGEPPFTGPTAQAIIAKRFAGEVAPLRRGRPAVPEAVDLTVLKALAPVPADRFATAADFAQALAVPAGATLATGTPALTATAASAATRRRRFPVGATTLVVGFLLGLGVLFGWLRAHDRAGSSAGVQRVAVLPFENLGRQEDEYFADGLTDAVRGKLAALPNLQVVARASSSQYRRTSKSPQEIGQELGVQYLLTGTVRWEKGAAGRDRVQVSPELVQVSTASTKWQEPFDAALTDFFQVQAEVATRVAQALGVALASGDRKRLGDEPTENLAAYDLYLRGTDYYERGYERENFRISRQMYERAVALDSSFALAWAGLSIVSAAEYWFFYDRTDEALARAKAAADQALRLDPDLPEAHVALGYYYYWGKLDYERALQELAQAQARQPSNAEVVFATGAVRRRQGNWSQAIADFTRKVELDPRSNVGYFNLGETYWLQRDYVRAERALDEAIGLAPDWALAYVLKAQTLLCAGARVPEAQAVLRTARDKVGLPPLARAIAANYNYGQPSFLLTADTIHGKEIAALPLSAFADSVDYYQLKAEVYRFMGRRKWERGYLDSARVALEAKVRARPEEASFRARLGVVDAYLGRGADANREGEAAIELLPVSREAYKGGGLVASLALIESLTGRQDAAVDRLEYLLSIPSAISRPMLRVDPAWSALRDSPRFQKLVTEQR
jgi:eukaryotic-like serine/threonine-protein kinase